MVGIIVCGAFVFNYVLATEQIPGHIAAWFAGLDLGPAGFLLVVNLLFLVLGLPFRHHHAAIGAGTAARPRGEGLGVDLVHFGVVIVFNMMIGMLTPPYGVLLYILSGLPGPR